MPNIIKGGVSFIPEIPVVHQPDEVTIKVNSEGKLYTELPEPEVFTPDWNAEEDSEGFISNKPSLTQGSDYGRSGVVIGSFDNTASGMFSVAEGYATKAIGDKSHAEGEATTSTGNRSHAEGYMTETQGIASHAEGSGSKAVGNASHAEGVGTVTSNVDGSHAQGRYNVSSPTLYDVVGYGSSQSARANLSALTTEGKLILKGSLIIGADNNSTGGYEIPIPTAYITEYNKPHALTVTVDDYGEVTTRWETFVEGDTQVYRSANTSATGPFTIYEGTTIPLASMGKVGDIYLKHN